MAYTPTGPAASTPDPQNPVATVSPTTLSKAIAPEPDLKLSPNSRDPASHLGSAIDTKPNQDDVQAWPAVDLAYVKSCNLDRLLKYVLSLRVPDGIMIDNDLLLEKCLKGVRPIRYLEVVMNCIERQ
ncbi:hypothetical protein OF83DRAFT_1286648 [Amylostereum chailletii]|nr:hypothetical protein OF83DRAFT_1286648 [Amylostereum chailletii]